ncbi:MAG: hypothetical protein NT150_01235 [Bacteroidetes bacterium]|nr:hypothetical protein [Bacteroidota bacterium]
MFKQFFRNKNTKWLLLILIISGLVVSDYFMHGYYNTEGYRGNVLDDKQSGEYRIACFGGSTTFGYGVTNDEAWPAQLNSELNKKGNYSVANLGANTQGIYGVSYDVLSYEYLHYDMAIISSGVTDRDPDELSNYNFRGDDVFFKLFGYKTILGFYFKEALRVLTPIDKNESKPVFTNKVANDSVRQRLSTYYTEVNQQAEEMILAGKIPYQKYIAQLDEVLNFLVQKNIRTILVCEPMTYHSIQQQKVRQLIKAKYSGKVEYVNLSELFPDVNKVSIDGMHLTKEGNKVVAEALRDSLFYH